PPSSGVMNPYPLSALNHLTVPVAISLLSPPCQLHVNGQERCKPAPSSTRSNCSEQCNQHLRARDSGSAAREHVEGDRAVLAAGRHERQEMKELVVAEDPRIRIRLAAGIDDRPRRVGGPAR